MTTLIVGLGNPGAQYSKTRHNIGFIAIDAIANHFSFPDFTSKFQGLLSQANINGKKVLLLKPQTFMNLSGRSVLECANFYKILPEQIIVIHDELDLELGRIKIKTGGSHAGHNGLKSIDQAVTPNYHRLRFGISRPKFGSASDYVLGNFRSEEEQMVNSSIKSILNNLHILLDSDFQKFMNNCAIDLQSNSGDK